MAAVAPVAVDVGEDEVFLFELAHATQCVGERFYTVRKGSDEEKHFAPLLEAALAAAVTRTANVRARATLQQVAASAPYSFGRIVVKYAQQDLVTDPLTGTTNWEQLPDWARQEVRARRAAGATGWIHLTRRFFQEQEGAENRRQRDAYAFPPLASDTVAAESGPYYTVVPRASWHRRLRFVVTATVPFDEVVLPAAMVWIKATHDCTPEPEQLAGHGARWADRL